MIQNAIEASDENGKVRVVVSSRDNAVSIQVEDDGQGIPSDLKEKVFDAFFTTRLERNASGWV